MNDPVYAGTFFGCGAGWGFAAGIPASISASSSAARGPATIMPTRCWVSATTSEFGDAVLAALKVPVR